MAALPKNVEWVTTDCYGTLIDWETGIADACEKEAARDGFTIDRGEFIRRFFEVQTELMAGSYELYAEVLRRTVVKVSTELGWEVESSRSQFLPDSVPYWPPYKEANEGMERLAGKFNLGVISNIDDKLLGVSRRHLGTPLDLVVTAQQVRSYKPDPTHFKEFARRVGNQRNWVHIASGYETDVAPLIKMKVPVIWINRQGEDLAGRKPPTKTVGTLLEATGELGAGG